MKARAVAEKLKKTYPKTLFVGDENDKLVVSRSPSGCFIFDMITGGGIPKNRYTVFHGPKSSGKTSFALRMAGQMQQANPNAEVLFVDFEGTLDKAWASNFMDTTRLITIRPDYGEEGIDAAKAMVEESDDIGMVIIDSLGGINAIKEAESSAADSMPPGLQVKLINRLLRILFPFISQAWKNDKDLTVVVINQVRINMKAGNYGSPYSQPGGEYLKHMISLDIRFYPGEFTKVRGVPVKAKHIFKISKNKIGLPERSGEFVMWYVDVDDAKTGEIEETNVVLTYAKRAGVIVRDGAKWKIPLKKNPLTFDTQLAMAEELKKNPKLFKVIRDRTLKLCIENPLFTSEEKE